MNRHLASRLGAFFAAPLLATLPLVGTAGADKPLVIPVEALFVACRAVTAEGTVVVEATGGGDGEGFVGLWAPGADPDVDDPVLATWQGLPTEQDGGRLSGRGPINDTSNGEVIGETMFRLEVVPVDENRVHDRERTGSRIVKVRGTRYAVHATGTVELPGVVTGLDGCEGSAATLEIWHNNPHSIQGNGAFALIECVVTNADGYRMELLGDDLDLSANVYPPGSEAKLLEAFAHDDTGAMLNADGIHYPLRVHDVATGAYLGDTVNAVSGTSLGRLTTIEQRFQDGRQTLRVVDAVLEGTIAFPGGIGFDVDGCQVSEFESRLHVSFLPGQAGTSVPSPNDGPHEAQPLKPGSTARAQTGGTAEGAEAWTSCVEKPAGGFGPMGKTVWYSVAGTGAPLVIDTGHSDFDTVVAVYRQDVSGLTEVACADDVSVHRFVDIPQTRLTVPTDPGVPYLLQVGGFRGEHGRLVVMTGR